MELSDTFTQVIANETHHNQCLRRQSNDVDNILGHDLAPNEPPVLTVDKTAIQGKRGIRFTNTGKWSDDSLSPLCVVPSLGDVMMHDDELELSYISLQLRNRSRSQKFLPTTESIRRISHSRSAPMRKSSTSKFRFSTEIRPEQFGQSNQCHRHDQEAASRPRSRCRYGRHRLRERH